MTYANAVSSYPSTKNQEYMAAIPKMNKITTSISQKSQHEVDESSIDPDGFIRVKANEVKQANFRDRNRRKCDVKPNSIFSETGVDLGFFKRQSKILGSDRFDVIVMTSPIR